MVESVYSAVRTDSLYKADYVWSLERLNKAITDWFFIAVVESVYSAVRTNSLYTANYVWSLER